MDIFYATHFGHTEQIAGSLAHAIRASGVPAALHDIRQHYPSHAQICSSDPCVLISPVRYGIHLPSARKLLKQIAPLTPRKPLFLLSVNLTARKEGRSRSLENPYLRKWISRSGAQPRLAEAIAGKLEYPQYNIVDRSMMRLMMMIAGGPADGQSVVDYTPWPHVSTLASRIVDLVNSDR